MGEDQIEPAVNLIIHIIGSLGLYDFRREPAERLDSRVRLARQWPNGAWMALRRQTEATEAVGALEGRPTDGM
jgi:hypothetical protein